MSLKKLFVIPVALTMAFGAVDTASASTDDIINACYAVNERDTYFMGSKCGGRGNARLITGALGMGAGAATLGAAGTIFGPLGTLGGLVAGGYIGGRLGGNISIDYSADEYLYFDGGDCLECDEYQTGEHWECPHGTIVTNGAEAFKCNVGRWNDGWEKIDLPVCSDSPIKKADLKEDGKYKSNIKDYITNNGMEVKPGVRKYSGAACIWIEEDPVAQNEQNGGNTNTNTNTNTNNNSIGDINIIINSCIGADNDATSCRGMHQDADCESDYAGFPHLIACCVHQRVHLTTMATGRSCQCNNPEYEWDEEKWTCVKKQQKSKSCEERFSAYPERLACCRAGLTTYWEPYNDLVNGKCICGDTRARTPNGKVWTSTGSGTGYCAGEATGPVNPVTPVDPNTQPEYVECNYTFTAKVRCKDGTKLDAMTNKTFTFAKGESVIKGANGACQAVGMIDIAMLLKDKFCQSHQGLYDGPDDAAVEAAKSSLQSFFKTAESTASVWKNEDGKFNTARLASDGTAAVVLGTVGGIVSSKVIKKKQLEKGYDALNCTIGGQKIADWGDEFQVGYTR